MASNMSSRLMTMKFMQRGAAKAALSEPSTPNGPPSKRVRLSDGTSAPRTPSDHEVIQAALAAEEKKREEAFDRASAKAGETKWVLSFKDPKHGSRPQGLQVVQAGFAVIDAGDDSDEEEEQRPARMQFGGGVKREKPVAYEVDEESDDGPSSSSEDYDSDDPTAELIQETKRDAYAKQREIQRARKREAAEQATKRSTKQVHEDMDLGGLSSLSGGRRGGLSSNKLSNVECFNCKGHGHLSRNCPEAKAKAPRGSAGRGGGGGWSRR